MPPEAATLEKPATPETQAAPAAETQATPAGGTDGAPAVQTGQVPATPAAADAGAAPDAGAAGSTEEPRYSAAALQAEREAAKAEALAEFEDAAAQRARDGGRSQAKNDLTTHYRTHSAEQRARLEAAGLAPEVIRHIMAPIDAMNLHQEEAVFATVGAEYHSETDRLLKAHKVDPVAFWGSFGQAEVTPSAVLSQVAESLALTTKAFKSAKAEALIEAHPGLKAHFAKAIDEAVDDAKKGVRPPTQPVSGGPAGTSMDYAALEKGYGAGTNTKAQDAQFLAMRADRKKK